MRIFLVTLLVSAAATIGLWNFGFAHKIWPAHPLLATIIIAGMCGVTAQLLLSYDTTRDSTRH
ncbi:MAG: hypothetical protein ACRD3T_04680 [Terriglobia bacterium]